MPNALWQKSFKEIPNFLQPFRRVPDLHKLAQTNAKIPDIWKNQNFLDLIFLSYKNFPHVKFWHVPVRTVDGESVSEIAIHNFEKSRKIEICVLPYGRKPNNNNL